MTISIRALAFGSLLSIGLSSLAAAEAPEPVTLRFLASQGSLSPHELAYELGYFDSLGIRLENVGYAGGGPASLFALASGSVDIGSAATAAVINSIAGGNDFVAAFPTNGKTQPYAMVDTVNMMPIMAGFVPNVFVR